MMRQLSFLNQSHESSLQGNDLLESADAFAHILVASGDEDELRTVEEMLEKRYFVHCVRSGKELLQSLRQTIPDLMILDEKMPDEEVFALLNQIRSMEGCREVPAILMVQAKRTGTQIFDMEIKGLNAGVSDLILKPFAEEIVFFRVNRILELARLKQDLQREVAYQTVEAERRRQQVERLSVQVIEALVSAIDAKDEYTNGHSIRVAEYAREIAKRYGLPEKTQADIYYMALLHDIGKIGIPDTIIQKTTGLTAEEYKLVLSHPTIGAEILRHISEMPGIDTAARWHHEKYDGTGYPDGLKGEEIPQFVRIIGVADAYDAMSSKRSYRDVLPQDVVRKEIVNGKGTQFDPVFADILIRMIDEDKEYQMREK